MSPSQVLAKARTVLRSVRSMWRTSPRPSIVAANSSPRCVLRTPITTWAPALASSVAAARPMPLVAPVITTVRPSREGRSAGVHLLVLGLMPWNVVTEYKDVNDNNDVGVYSRVYAVPSMAVSTRPYHHGNLRPALLEAAERALARGDELSLRSLAREVGVSHAAPRRHFADKQALLDALAEDGFERLGSEMRDAIAGA